MNKLVTKVFCSLVASLLIFCLLFVNQSFAATTHELKASLGPTQYKITTSCSNGYIDPNMYVAKGKNIKIHYDAFRGYYVKSISIDGKSVSPSKYPTAYKFTSVTKKHSIKVVCAIKKYNVKVNVYTLPAGETALTKAKLKGTYNKVFSYNSSDILVKLPTSSYNCFAIVAGARRYGGVKTLPMMRAAEEFGFKSQNVTSTSNVLKIYYQERSTTSGGNAIVVDSDEHQPANVTPSYDVMFTSDEGASINANKLSVEEGCVIDKLPNAELKFGYMANGWVADEDVVLKDGTEIEAGEVMSPFVARMIKVTEPLNLSYVTDELDEQLAYASVSSSIENGVINYCGNVNLVNGSDCVFEYVPYDGYEVKSVQIGNTIYEVKSWKSYENSYKIKNVTGATTVKVKCVKID